MLRTCSCAAHVLLEGTGAAPYKCSLQLGRMYKSGWPAAGSSVWYSMRDTIVGSDSVVEVLPYEKPSVLSCCSWLIFDMISNYHVIRPEISCTFDKVTMTNLHSHLQDIYTYIYIYISLIDIID